MKCQNIYEFFSSRVDKHPDHPFIWFEGETQTYDTTDAEIDRRANLLYRSSVRSGDRVALLLQNSPEFLYFLFATAKVGGTSVLLDPRREESTLEYLLTDSAPTALIVDSAAYEKYRSIDSELELSAVVTHEVDNTEAETDLEGARGDSPTEIPNELRSGPDDIAIINYTSGTTGPPKGVLNPHRAFIDAGRRAVDACGTGPADRGLLVLPLFHANPITYGIMHMIAAGGSIAIVREFSASGFWTTARESNATFFTHVGTILEILKRYAATNDVETNNPMKFTMGGAAHFDEDNQRWFESIFDLQIIRLYGMSELGAGLLTVCRHDDSRDHAPIHQGSVAEQPFDVRILREDCLLWAEPNEEGEIVVRNDLPATIFRGYLGKPETTVEDWQDLWMHTGDLGRIDDDGNLHFLGRLKTTIRKGGENVSPWEIESVVKEWSTVEAVAAVGVPDTVVGEEIHLYVVPQGDISEREIHEQCRSALASHLVPRYITLSDELPKTRTQKIKRSELTNKGTAEAWDSNEKIP